MKNRKKTYIIVGLLIAIITLGVGYAAVADLLTINGNATALPVGADVTFDSTTAPSTSGGQTGTTASIDTTGDTTNHTAICTVVLKTYNEQATCTYTIKNTSTDTALNATNITATVYESDGITAWSSDYFTITAAPTVTTLANNATTTVVVTVVLKQVNVTGSNVTESFVVKVSADTAQASS